jgi:nitrate reductase assembly molybdenum cofactor insertion protein NarJ
MKKSIADYELIAGLFEYPDPGFPGTVTEIQAHLDDRYPVAGEMLRPFAQFVSEASLLDIEELFIRSFDVQAITTLDIGYVLFGDDYKRGELLVNLNREHKKVQNDCRNELSDHLSNVLRLLPKMQDQEIVAELIEKMIAPVLRKMIREFDSDRIKAKEKSYKKHYKTLIERSARYYTIYQKTLMALYEILKQDFDFQEQDERDDRSSDFLKSIDSEMATESGERLQQARENLQKGQMPCNQ